MNRKLMPKASCRKGVLLVVTLAAMTIVIGILLPMIPPALRARRQIQREQVSLQVEYLRAAAVQYAIGQIAENESYSGEEIRIALGSNHEWVGECVIGYDSTQANEKKLKVKVKIRPAYPSIPMNSYSITTESEQEWILGNRESNLQPNHIQNQPAN